MGRRPTRNEKVLQHIGLVRSLIVAKYGARAVHDEDLHQAGLMGLMLAVDSFERDRVQGRFSSYARTCIISELAKSTLASGRRLLPHRQYYERIAIQRHAEDITHVLGREPSVTEILESWPADSRPPTPSAVERALVPDPVMVIESVVDVDDDREFGDHSDVHDSTTIEDLLDAKRRFERLSPETQARLTRGGHRRG